MREKTQLSLSLFFSIFFFSFSFLVWVFGHRLPSLGVLLLGFYLFLVFALNHRQTHLSKSSVISHQSSEQLCFLLEWLHNIQCHLPFTVSYFHTYLQLTNQFRKILFKSTFCLLQWQMGARNFVIVQCTLSMHRTKKRQIVYKQ